MIDYILLYVHKGLKDDNAIFSLRTFRSNQFLGHFGEDALGISNLILSGVKRKQCVQSSLKSSSVFILFCLIYNSVKKTSQKLQVQELRGLVLCSTVCTTGLLIMNRPIFCPNWSLLFCFFFIIIDEIPIVCSAVCKALRIWSYDSQPPLGIGLLTIIIEYRIAKHFPSDVI